MAVNALPPSPASAPGPAATGVGRKGDDATQDPAFASLLATLLGPMAGVNPVMAMLPGAASTDAAQGASPAVTVPVANQGVHAGGGQAPLSAALANLMAAVDPGTQASQGAQALPAAQASLPFDDVLTAVQAPAQEQVPASTQQSLPAMPLIVPVPPEPPAPPVDLAQAVTDALKQAQIVAAQPNLGTGQANVAKVESGQQKEPVKVQVAGLPAAGQTPTVAFSDLHSVVQAPATTNQSRDDGRREPDTKAGSRPEAPVLNNSVFQPPVVHSGPDKPQSLENIPNPIDPARLMDALAQSVSSAKPGHYTVTLQLYPDSLGEVRMQVQITGREVHTTMQVTNPESQKVLEDRGDQLRQALGQSGLTLSGFQVSTGSGNQTPQERRDRLNEQLASQRRIGRISRIAGTQAPTRPDIQRTPGRDRAGGVLDTLA